MNSEIFGWQGKILKIDLSNSTSTERDTMDYAPRFLGGRGIATKIYWDEVAPEIRAFDPENYLIFMSGPLVGTGAQGVSRFVVIGKSPMLRPEGFCYGNMGGYFASALKSTGYDGLIVTGAAERPCCILITDNGVEIQDAAHLWGQDTYQVRDILRDQYGPRVRFVTTGVAGENRCRTATLRTDLEGNATGGFGAVFGAKQLKAIAVIGTKRRPRVAHPERLRELNRLTVKLSKRGTLRMPMPKDQITYLRKAPCHQCGLDCLRALFRTASGKEAIRKCQAMYFYMPWLIKRPEEKLETMLDVTGICNTLSLCTMEMENITCWLDNCYQAGYLSEADTGLPLSKIGSLEFFQALADMIARRKGLGDILAEGLLRAGDHLGEEAISHFSEDVSGVGLGASYSPREYVINALLYALEPRQPIAMLHEISFMIARWLLHRIRPDLSITTSEVFRAAAEKFWGSDKAWDMTTYEGKALAAVKIQDRTYVKDCLPLCDFVWPIMDSFNTPDHVGDPTLEGRIFSAVTGIETDEAGLNRYGERIFNLQRGVLLLEGRPPKASDIPAEFNFTQPIQTNPVNPRLLVPGPTEEPASVKGFVLDRKKYEEIREEFYELRGWDTETGLQKTETLEQLELSDMAQALKMKGLIV